MAWTREGLNTGHEITKVRKHEVGRSVDCSWQRVSVDGRGCPRSLEQPDDGVWSGSAEVLLDTRIGCIEFSPLPSCFRAFVINPNFVCGAAAAFSLRVRSSGAAEFSARVRWAGGWIDWIGCYGPGCSDCCEVIASREAVRLRPHGNVCRCSRELACTSPVTAGWLEKKSFARCPTPAKALTCNRRENHT